MFLGEWIHASVTLIAVMTFLAAPIVAIGGFVVYKTLRGDRARPPLA